MAQGRISNEKQPAPATPYLVVQPGSNSVRSGAADNGRSPDRARACLRSRGQTPGCAGAASRPRLGAALSRPYCCTPASTARSTASTSPKARKSMPEICWPRSTRGPYQAALEIRSNAKKSADEAQLTSAQVRPLTRYQAALPTRRWRRARRSRAVTALAATLGSQRSRATRPPIATARLNLEFTRITSPIDGRVGLRLVDPGNLIRSSEADRPGLDHPDPPDLGRVHVAAGTVADAILKAMAAHGGRSRRRRRPKRQSPGVRLLR